MKFEGKIAVITGAASGMGRATALRFASEGATVVAADINEAGLADLSKETNGVIRSKRCDVSSDAEMKELMHYAVETAGGIDILFNNAGAPGAKENIQDISAETFDRMMAFLLRSPAMGIRYAAPHMKARGGGSIINTASVAGMRSGMGRTAYSIAKAGVLQLTTIAAAELGRDRIRVNAILPGLITTNLFQDVFGVTPQEFEALRPRLLELAVDAQPIPLAGQPEDIAGAVAFLASDDARFITGQHLIVDGGMTLGERRAWDFSLKGPLEELFKREA